METLHEFMTGIKPDIKIGEYYISKSACSSDKIHINHESGEGGDFSKEDFYKALGKIPQRYMSSYESLKKAIDKFYQENF